MKSTSARNSIWSRFVDTASRAHRPDYSDLSPFVDRWAERISTYVYHPAILGVGQHVISLTDRSIDLATRSKRQCSCLSAGIVTENSTHCGQAADGKN
jgi:hypothetical protein